MLNNGMFTSNSEEWATPKAFYDLLNSEFHFTLDVCATLENAKCKNYFTKADNGLAKSWKSTEGGAVYCNPPYGRQISKWVEKAYEENKKGITIVLLLPARTDTKWFHDYIYHKHEIRFIKGRLHFNDSKQSAPFPSMVIVMRGIING